jgi:hypothetical protein
LSYDPATGKATRNEQLIAGGVPIFAFGEDQEGEVYYSRDTNRSEVLYRFEVDPKEQNCPQLLLKFRDVYTLYRLTAGHRPALIVTGQLCPSTRPPIHPRQRKHRRNNNYFKGSMVFDSID